MPELEWTEETTFTDAARNFQAVGSGVYNVPEETIEEYLAHRTGGWQEPSNEHEDEDDSGPDQDDEDGAAEPSNEQEDEDGSGIGSALDSSVEHLEHALASGEFDDVLDALERAERDGRDRSTAIQAIQTRRNDLESDTDG